MINAIMIPMSNIVNLSSHVLLPHQETLLHKGLSYVPTPRRPNPGDLRADLDTFHDKLRKAYHFRNKEPQGVLQSNTQSSSQAGQPDSLVSQSYSQSGTQSDTQSDTQSSVFVSQQGFGSATPRQGSLPAQAQPHLGSAGPFKHTMFNDPSTWRVPRNCVQLETMIEANIRDFYNRPPEHSSHRHNLSPMERKAIDELFNNKSIIIREADKGGAVVLWDRDDYLNEGHRQLRDPKFYRPLPQDVTNTFNIEIGAFLHTLHNIGEIDEKVFLYLTRENHRTPALYLLPKIHKSTRPPVGRPIVSGNRCATERISKFVDFFLKPFCPLLPSYVRDTTHFLHILNNVGALPPDTLLVTMDVTSLYTNIPNEEGMQVIRELLHNKRPTHGIYPSNWALNQLLEFVLTKNNFTFNDLHYLQVGGTAMGTRVAPTYAILYMGDFEQKHIYTYSLQPILYLRFIDDVFMLWTHGETQLLRFIDHVNGANDNIKFTHEFSRHQVSFLDTMVNFRQGELVTDLYSKPTDRHNYLHYNSAHPQSCKTSIPYSQFLRVRRICSTKADYIRHVLDLSRVFLRRNYPEPLIRQAALTVLRMKRDTLLVKHTSSLEDMEDPIPFKTTYHPHHHETPRIVHNNFVMLQSSNSTRPIHKRGFLCSFRRNKNLRQLLTRARVPWQQQDARLDPLHRTPPVAPTNTAPRPNDKCKGPCLSPNICMICPRLNTTGRLKGKYAERSGRAMHNITCRSSNLIYVVTCTRCGLQYVGQTHQSIKMRFGMHRQDIKKKLKAKTLSNHFTSPGHNNFEDCSISVVEFIRTPPLAKCSIHIRNKAERRWIDELRTMHPWGLNKEYPKLYASHRRK